MNLNVITLSDKQSLREEPHSSCAAAFQCQLLTLLIRGFTLRCRGQGTAHHLLINNIKTRKPRRREGEGDGKGGSGMGEERQRSRKLKNKPRGARVILQRGRVFFFFFPKLSLADFTSEESNLSSSLLPLLLLPAHVIKRTAVLYITMFRSALLS